jgi:cytochrome P450
MLQWFMDAAFGHSERFANRELAIRVLVLNFASIHTTSNSVAHCLYHLAVDPVSVDVLRKELEDVITTHGWTKAAMARLHLMDSVLRETARFTGLNGREYAYALRLPPTDQSVSITRIAVKPHTFRDGTFVPRGAFLGCPTSAVHADGLNYPSPRLFKPFRFVDATDKDSVASKQTSQFASTRSSYIPFGHGKSACPGRFFASVEMLVLIALSEDRG